MGVSQVNHLQVVSHALNKTFLYEHICDTPTIMVDNCPTLQNGVGAQLVCQVALANGMVKNLLALISM